VPGFLFGARIFVDADFSNFSARCVFARTILNSDANFAASGRKVGGLRSAMIS
jgi:hypothetical protein